MAKHNRGSLAKLILLYRVSTINTYPANSSYLIPTHTLPNTVSNCVQLLAAFIYTYRKFYFLPIEKMCNTQQRQVPIMNSRPTERAKIWPSQIFTVTKKTTTYIEANNGIFYEIYLIFRNVEKSINIDQERCEKMGF